MKGLPKEHNKRHHGLGDLNMTNNINKRKQTRDVSHTMTLPFTLKCILRQKKNYENSNISTCKNIIFKKSFKRNQNPSRFYN